MKIESTIKITLADGTKIEIPQSEALELYQKLGKILNIKYEQFITYPIYPDGVRTPIEPNKYEPIPVWCNTGIDTSECGKYSCGI